MGGVKMCDKRCHQARRDRCSCWCRGTFHGARGAGARIDYYRTYKTMVPPTEEEYNAVVGKGGERVEVDAAAAAAIAPLHHL